MIDRELPPGLRRAREMAAAFKGKTDVGPLAAKKNAAGTEGELIIYAPIGFSFWEDGVTAKQVIEKLDELKGVSKLSVRINSPGGDVWDGKAIENAIRRFDCAEKVTYVDGLAASAATFIAMACPKVVSAANATWMIHEASWMAVGRASDLRAVADVLEKENRTIADTYARKTGKSSDECLDLMAKETWMNAEEAKGHGFTDEIEECEGEPANRSSASAVAPAPPPERKRTAAEIVAQARAQFQEIANRFPAASGGTQHPGQPGTANASVPANRQESNR